MFAVWSRYVDVAAQSGFLPSLAPSWLHPVAVQPALHVRRLGHLQQSYARSGSSVRALRQTGGDPDGNHAGPRRECQPLALSLHRSAVRAGPVHPAPAGGAGALRAHRQPGGENGIYCNSLFGAIQWPDRLERYSGGRLLLLAGNQVRAHHPCWPCATAMARGRFQHHRRRVPALHAGAERTALHPAAARGAAVAGRAGRAE